MTIPKDTKYPVRCTNLVWQKQKSFKDKTRATTKTGLGESLKAAEKAWAEIKWEQLDAKKLKAKSPMVAIENQKKAQAMMDKVETAKKAVDAAEQKARATEGNQALSNTAKLGAGNIANGLKVALQRLNSVNINDFEEAKNKLL